MVLSRNEEEKEKTLEYRSVKSYSNQCIHSHLYDNAQMQVKKKTISLGMVSASARNT